MRLRTVAILVLLSGQAHAGDISSAGDAIEVENYKCIVLDSRTIQCKNIGRICEAARSDDEVGDWHKKFFGCGVRHVPCPTDEEWKAHHEALRGCEPMVFGMF